MPRTARASVGGICYHVIDRSNGGRKVFRTENDYQAFLKAMAHACVEIPMPVLGYCLMPDHFHLVVRPPGDGDLSRWMHWVLNMHVRRHHQQHQSRGHIWEGRFRAFPIEENEPLLTVLRYVERNPVRAQLVRRAERWRWSSASCWTEEAARPSFLTAGPIKRPRNWLERVHEAITRDELAAVRRSVNRGTPFGSAGWVETTVKRLDLQSTLRPRGRPRSLARPVVVK